MVPEFYRTVVMCDENEASVGKKWGKSERSRTCDGEKGVEVRAMCFTNHQVLFKYSHAPIVQRSPQIHLSLKDARSEKRKNVYRKMHPF